MGFVEESTRIGPYGVTTCVEWFIRVHVVGDPPDFKNRAGNQFFGRLCDTGRFDLVWVRTRIWWGW